MAKNLNKEHSKLKKWEAKISEVISGFAGSIHFIIAHGIFFVLWILINLGLIAFLKMNFDPYPFNLLTLIVSLEAIFLSTFVLISQNRQAEREELRAELDYKTDVKAEKEIADIKKLVEQIARKNNINIKGK